LVLFSYSHSIVASRLDLELICFLCIVISLIWIFLSTNLIDLFCVYLIELNNVGCLQYESLCGHYISLVHLETLQVVNAFTSISKEITMIAINDNITWPYFTSPYFEYHSQLDRNLAKAYVQGIVPLVRREERKMWEQYSVENQYWTAVPDTLYSNQVYETQRRTSTIQTNFQTLQKQQQQRYRLDEDSTNMTHSAPSIIPYIHRNENYTDGASVNQTDDNDIYGPMWQNSPLDIELVNFDMLSYPPYGRGFEALRETSENIFTEAIFPSINETSRFLDPFAIVMSPIFSTFYNQNDADKFHGEDIVGLICSLMPWTSFFSDLYEFESLNGLILVLTDPQKMTFTFRIDGPKVRKIMYDLLFGNEILRC
jgi:hypothetical protein